MAYEKKRLANAVEMPEVRRDVLKSQPVAQLWILRSRASVCAMSTASTTAVRRVPEACSGQRSSKGHSAEKQDRASGTNAIRRTHAAENNLEGALGARSTERVAAIREGRNVFSAESRTRLPTGFGRRAR